MKLITKREKQSRQSISAFYKIAALILIFAIFVTSLSSCTEKNAVPVGKDTPVTEKKANNDDANSKANMTIGYNADDSLNPYFMKTDINLDIISLCYEPLFTLDDTFCAVNSLGSSYSVKDNKLTVALDTSAAFSDGVQFSSSDVVYSFNIAKKSNNYKSELTGIASATAIAPDRVVFNLSDGKKNAVDALTFPIVKAGSAENEASLPIGTGLYSLSHTEVGISFKYNPYSRKPEPDIKAINGIAINTASTLIHTLELGTIDAFFDNMSQGSYSHVSGQTAKTNLPNLVFVGMNSKSYGLNTAAVRQAVFYSINRQAIATESFKKYAVAAFAPYHPQWHLFENSGYNAENLTLDLALAKSLMESAGIREKVNMRLIVYSGNNFKVAMAKSVKDSLSQIGINVTIYEYLWDDYKNALALGAYDLYIGEVKVPASMDLSALFGKSSVISGISENDSTGAAYEEFEQGNISLAAFTDSFIQNMPFAPVVYRMGALVYSDNISAAADCDYMNSYKNIYEWKLSDNFQG